MAGDMPNTDIAVDPARPAALSDLDDMPLLRIEGVAKALDQPIVVSDDFAQAYGAPLRSIGYHQFRGLATPRELFGPQL